MSILIVDDVGYMRECFSSALQRVGYTTIEAGTGAEAVKKFAEHQESIDLMLVDVDLQDTTGKEVITLSRQIKPSIKAILISAYDARDLQSLFADIHVEDILPKPISMKLLRQVVAQHYQRSQIA